MKNPFSLLVLLALAAPLSAQATLLTEDFESGLVPPAGWGQLINGSVGSTFWTAGDVSVNLRGNGMWAAYHDDGPSGGIFNDNYLVAPKMDASGVSALFAHMVEYQVFPTFYLFHAVEVATTVGPPTVGDFVFVAEGGNQGAALKNADVNLGAYAGQSSVWLGFHYTGDFADEWYVDDLVVDDQCPPPPAQLWPNLPATKMALVPGANLEDFESHAGVVPAHMAVNELTADHSAYDPEAWCNIGQNAAPLVPFGGLYALEMGLIPGSTNYHDVANALIIGLDGTGVQGPITMDYMLYDAGEEGSAADGIFVSQDGVTYTRVSDDWTTQSISTSVWEAKTGVDLSSSSVNTSAPFFLALQQTDNFPFNDLDGVSIDDIVINAGGANTDIVLYTGTPINGLPMDVTAANLVAGDKVIFAYSLQLGPTTTGACGSIGIGNGSLAAVKKIGGTNTATGSELTISPTVPAGLCGLTAHLQAAAIRSGVCMLSNVVTITVF
ncbi:MAG TPA: choice-of-anchor J domain-containing protein [Planctomycetota bacterium]